MDLDGDYYWDFTLGSDIDPGTQAQPFQNASVFNNADSIAPGTTINLKRGEVWRQNWTCPDSGAAGNVITMRPYDTGADPIIDGSDDALGMVGDWSDEGGDMWSRDFSADGKNDPYLVVFDGTVGTREAASGDVDAVGEWYWDDGTDILYVYSIGNPATAFSTLAMAQRTGIDCNDQSYWTIDGIEVRYCQLVNEAAAATQGGGGIYLPIGTNNILITNCTFIDNHGYHIHCRKVDQVTIDGNVWGDTYANSHPLGTFGDWIVVGGDPTTEEQSTNVTITDNTANAKTGRQGIAATSVNGLTVSDNDLTVTSWDVGNNLIAIEANADNTVENITIDNNVGDLTAVGGNFLSIHGAHGGSVARDVTVTRNEADLGGVLNSKGYVINELTLTGDENLFQYNKILNADRPVQILGGSTATLKHEWYQDENRSVANSVCIQATASTVEVQNSVIVGYGFDLFATTSAVVRFNNNTCSRGRLQHIRSVTNSTVTVKNNIFQTDADGIETMVVDATGNGTYDNNLYWDAGDGDGGVFNDGAPKTFAEWQTAGNDLSGLAADPLFQDPAADQYWLQSSSPAVDSGDTLADAYELGLDPDSVWPDGVVLANQNDEGTGWEIGAYIFELESSSSCTSPAVDVCPAGKSMSMVGPAGSTLAIPV